MRFYISLSSGERGKEQKERETERKDISPEEKDIQEEDINIRKGTRLVCVITSN